MDMGRDGRKKRVATPDEEPPPFLGSWNRLYAAIILYTLLLILALHFMTITFNR